MEYFGKKDRKGNNYTFFRTYQIPCQQQNINLHYQQYSGAGLFSSELETSLLNLQKTLDHYNSLKSVECDRTEGASNMDKNKSKGKTISSYSEMSNLQM